MKADLVFHQAENSSIAIPIIPSRAVNPEMEKKLRAFKIRPQTSLSGEEFVQILYKGRKANAPSKEGL